MWSRITKDHNTAVLFWFMQHYFFYPWATVPAIKMFSNIDPLFSCLCLHLTHLPVLAFSFSCFWAVWGYAGCFVLATTFLLTTCIHQPFVLMTHSCWSILKMVMLAQVLQLQQSGIWKKCFVAFVLSWEKWRLMILITMSIRSGKN